MAFPRSIVLAGLLLAGGAAAYGITLGDLLQDPPKPRVDPITDADSDLLPVKSRAGDPADDLLDPYPDKPGADEAADPRPPANVGDKAGKHPSPPINGSFAFDLVIGYIGQVPGAGMVQSYYLLDSRSGHIGMDRGAIESMGNMPAAGEGGSLDFQVMTNAGDHYSYMTSAEMGRVAMSVRSGESPLGRDLNAFFAGDWFENDFKPTGKVRDIGSDLRGGKYRSTEYAGTNPETGKPLRIWLATPDFEVAFYAAAYMGTGVVALPKANVQRLVTRMEGEGAVFEISYVMRKSQRFSGAGYKDFSAVMAGYGARAVQP